MIKISIDLGHCFSSVGFVHGNQVMALKPKEERDGKRIPTIYYRDKKQSACGSAAKRLGKRRPECMVEYMKKKLEEPEIVLDGIKMTPGEIVKEFLQYLIRGAEQSAREEFFLEKEEIGVLLTVPVLFGEKKKKILEKAVAAIRLEDGRGVKLLKLVTEPEAAAMDNLELYKEKTPGKKAGKGANSPKKEAKQDKNSVMVYDLGGGTFDTAIFQLTGDKENPCKILGLDGRAVGGYDWDICTKEIIEEKLRVQLGAQGDAMLSKKNLDLLEEARKLKEELSSNMTAETSINIQGTYYEVQVSREEFENRTKQLLQETLEPMEHLAKRYQTYPVTDIILVGGSSYMPQVGKAIREAFPKARVNLKNPELAIAFGGARMVHMLKEEKGEKQSMKTVKIGIDFGTTCSFVSFVHGDKVMALTPSSDRHGIPTVFYYDGKQEYVGKFADNRGRKQPQFAVRSIKRKLHEESILLADKTYTPKEILTKIFAFLLDTAEKRLEAEFPDVEYEAIEVAVAMPVDFTVPRVHMILQALKEVVLKSGKKVYVDGVIQEPSAAAVEYFGLTGQQDVDVLAYDLGGGTFDAALVHAKKDADTPYEVVDQEGIRTLGGDDWDKALCSWAVEQLKNEYNISVTTQQEKELLCIAREVKHELTEIEETYFDCAIRGETYSLPLTRKIFEELTAAMLSKTLEVTETLLNRNKDRNVKYLILTGGSSYMPQVKNSLKKLAEKYHLEVRFFEPEHAITYGAARYAHSLVWDGEREAKGFKGRAEDSAEEKKKTDKKGVIDLIAPHGYGIAYIIGGTNGKEMIRLFVKKGDKIPAASEEVSRKNGRNRYVSEYKIYETDSLDPSDIVRKGGRELVDMDKGRLVMTVNLERKKEVPQGGKATQRITFGEDMCLYFEAFDEINGARVDCKIGMTMASVEE